jgi:hypothetical protein
MTHQHIRKSPREQANVSRGNSTQDEILSRETRDNLLLSRTGVLRLQHTVGNRSLIGHQPPLCSVKCANRLVNMTNSSLSRMIWTLCKDTENELGNRLVASAG